MKKRIITVTVIYDMEDIPENMIPDKEKVKDMVANNMIENFGWDEGYDGIEVEVIDI